MKYSYRIIQDGNGDMIAQKQIGEGTNSNPHRWVFFIDLEHCTSVKQAEMELRISIARLNQKVVGHYDEAGRRI